MGRRGLPAHDRMVPVLCGKLCNDDFKPPSSPAVVWSKRSIVTMNIADVITSVCSNIDGSIGLMSRIRDFAMSSQQGDLKMQFLACSVWKCFCVRFCTVSSQCLLLMVVSIFGPGSVKTRIQLLQKARDLLRDLKEKEPSDELIPRVEKRAKELLQTATDLQRECEQSMVRKVLSASKLSELKAEVWEISFYALMLNMLTSPPPSGGSTMHCRIVEGLPIVFTNDPHQVAMLTATLKDVPKVWKPILQPMGDAVARLPGIETTFSHVLPVVAADADWNLVPDPDSPTLHNIKLEREQALTKDFGCPDAGAGEIPDEDVPGQGSVRRLWSDPEGFLRGVASDEGKIYMLQKENKLFRGDLNGFTEINGHLGVPHWPDGFAVSGNKLVAIDRDYLWVGEICESDAGKSFQKKFDKKLEFGLRGVSMNESYAYYCSGHSVQSLDLVTGWISPVMGDRGRNGCGSVEVAAKDLLLNDPQGTALVGHSLFVADSGNGRVLCYDMRRNECRIIFEGTRPLRLGADHGSLFIYDSAQDKIFHVDLDTWRIEHVLGTGIRGSSPEGLPPLSTHLGEICSMTVGHDGELVYIEDNHILRAFKMAPKVASDPRALCAKNVALFHEGSGEESDALVPLPELQPTYGAEWRVFCRNSVPMPMFASEILPLDRNRLSFKFSLASPTHGLGISLVPGVNTHGTNATVDSHLISPPDWAAKTFVSTLSVMQELEKKPFRKIWKAAMASFRNMVTNSEAGQETSLGKPFHFRNQNHFEVVVERSYDEDADCCVWKLVEVLINGKKRAGSLKSLIAGVDVGVRICIFVAQDGGSLEFLGEPKLV